MLALVLGAASFAGLGLAIAALVRSGEAIAAVVNVIILPMAFLSGSFGPAERPARSPEAARATSCRCTTCSSSCSAPTSTATPSGSDPTAIAVLVAWGAAGYVVARRRFGWEPRER